MKKSHNEDINIKLLTCGASKGNNSFYELIVYGITYFKLH
jgi:hypothetical protein